jgi:hypothetical protein
VAQLAIVRLQSKYLFVENALAYYEKSQINAEKFSNFLPIFSKKHFSRIASFFNFRVRRHDTRHNDTRSNDTLHTALNVMAFSRTTFNVINIKVVCVEKCRVSFCRVS